MVEIQCPSCQTRYRIDEQVVPDESPTFKCSRCGHVFASEPRTPKAPAKASSSKTIALRKKTPARRPPLSPKPENAITPQGAARVAHSTAATAAATSVQPAPRVEVPIPSTDELLNRSFQEAREEPKPGESLSFFEFAEESREDRSASEPVTETVETDEDTWEVGEGSGAAMEFGVESPDPAEAKLTSAMSAIRGSAAERAAALRPSADDFDTVPLGHAVHSAGFFLAMFFFATLGFGAASLLICGAPAASASLLARLPVVGERFTSPLVSAVAVALRDVHADYRKIGGGKTALIIDGQAQNVGNQPLHVVRIGAALLDSSRHAITQQSVYCGNTLSSRMIGELTPREIEFFERLEPPTSFAVQPSATAPFVIVIVDPPPHADKFAISVTQTERAAASPASQTTGAAQRPGP